MRRTALDGYEYESSNILEYNESDVETKILPYIDRQKDWIDAALTQKLAHAFITSVAKLEFINRQVNLRYGIGAGLRPVVISSGSYLLRNDIIFEYPRIPGDIDLVYFASTPNASTAANIDVWLETTAQTSIILSAQGIEFIKTPHLSYSELQYVPKSRPAFLHKLFSPEEIITILNYPDIQKFLKNNGQIVDDIKMQAIEYGERDIYQEVQIMRGMPAIAPGSEKRNNMDNYNDTALHVGPNEFNPGYLETNVTYVDGLPIENGLTQVTNSRTVWCADPHDTLAYKLARILCTSNEKKRLRDVMDIYNIITASPALIDRDICPQALEILVAGYIPTVIRLEESLKQLNPSLRQQWINNVYPYTIPVQEALQLFHNTESKWMKPMIDPVCKQLKRMEQSWVNHSKRAKSVPMLSLDFFDDAIAEPEKFMDAIKNDSNYLVNIPPERAGHILHTVADFIHANLHEYIQDNLIVFDGPLEKYVRTLMHGVFTGERKINMQGTVNELLKHEKYAPLLEHYPNLPYSLSACALINHAAGITR